MTEEHAARHRIFYQSPVGWLRIESNGSSVTRIWFCDTPEPWEDLPDMLTLEAEKQLREYFQGTRTVFDLPLDLSCSGTGFQQTVWAALTRIPFGKTISYLELSRRIGNVKAIRAVGQANGQNPLPIVVPCHRVIGSDGSLTGYGGGLWRKKRLLQHEHVLPPEFAF